MGRIRIDIPGHWVAAARKSQGFTQADLAREVRIRGGQKTVSSWETSGCSYVVWLGILYALRLPITWRPPGEPRIDEIDAATRAQRMRTADAEAELERREKEGDG